MGEAENVTFRRNNLLWTTPVSDRDISRSLFVQGEHQGRDVANLKEWLIPRSYLDDSKQWIIDIGANIGTPSIPLALVTGKKVLAVEPSPINYALLHRNVEQNGLCDRIVCAQYAISDESGEVTLIIHDYGGRNEVQSSSGEQGFGQVEESFEKVGIPSRRLDDLLAEKEISSDDVALVWSDTQGFERQVIASAQSLWNAGVPLLCELWPQGLSVHGGLEAFVSLVEEKFKAFVLTTELDSHGARTPTRQISDLKIVLDGLTGKKHTDAIFLPQ